MPGTRTCVKWNVAVILGGPSPEREISLQSGAAVAQALATSGHRVTTIDPQDQPLPSVDWSAINVAFIALHGTYGEDGTVQRELEQLGVCYTGSGPDASRRAFHKLEAKRVFLEQRLPTPEFALVRRHCSTEELQTAARQIGCPLVVKPEAQGSSIGVSLVEEISQLQPAVALAGRYGDEILLERAIPGDEWTVPLLDDDVLTPIRISTPHEFFDFSAKYEDDETVYELIDVGTDPVADDVAALALRACRELKTRGICRVDLRVDPHHRPWLLEVNTIPGLTDHSLVPKSAAARGWDMAELCARAIHSALARHPAAGHHR